MSKFLDVALEAIKRSEKTIIDYYEKSNFTITKKADSSPVTEADKKAEEIIIQTIKDKFPDHIFFGEESGGKVGPEKYTWIIDPIDGTKNFTRHIPYFSTLIALVKDGDVLLGISHAPVLKTTMYATKGEGTFLDDKKVKVSNIDNISDAWVNHGGINHFAKKGYNAGLINISRDCARIRGFGDFWMHELVAEGKFEVSMEAKVKFWDVAPFKIIVEEAGGKVTDIEGNPLTPESTSILATNKHIHDKVVKYFK